MLNLCLIHGENFPSADRTPATLNRKSDPVSNRNGWVKVPRSHGHHVITRPLRRPCSEVRHNELGHPEIFGRKQATQSHDDPN